MTKCQSVTNLPKSRCDCKGVHKMVSVEWVLSINLIALSQPLMHIPRSDGSSVRTGEYQTVLNTKIGVSLRPVFQ